MLKLYGFLFVLALLGKFIFTVLLLVCFVSVLRGFAKVIGKLGREGLVTAVLANLTPT